MIIIFFKIAMALVLGILSVEFINIEAVVIFGIIITVLNKPVRKFVPFVGKGWWLIFISFAIGSIVSFNAQSYETNDLFEVDDKFISLSGYVYEIPKEKDGKNTYVIKSESGEYGGTVYKSDELVQMSSETQLKYGQAVKVRGFLKRFKERNNRSDFDYCLYYKSRGIKYSISDFEVNPGEMKEIKSIAHTVNKIKLKIGFFIDEHFTGDRAAILKAIVIGQKNNFSDEFSDVLNKTNTIRLFFPAYFHIYLIMLVVNCLL